MERRPWPIVILAVLHIVEPLLKVLLYSWYWRYPIANVLNAPGLSHPFNFFMFFLAFPLAGIAIFCVKRWSLPVFMMIEALTLIGHFQNFQQAPQFFSLAFICTMSLLNLGVVSYFLIPAVRLAYIDPKVRWWESKPRYTVEWAVRITQGTHSMEATILNISMGGVLLKESVEALVKEVPIRMEFSHRDKSFVLTGKIAHQLIKHGVYRYGIKFDPLDREHKANLHYCLKSLDKDGVERRPRKEWFYHSLWQWALTLVTTGRGLVPHIDHHASHSTEKIEPQLAAVTKLPVKRKKPKAMTAKKSKTKAKSKSKSSLKKAS